MLEYQCKICRHPGHNVKTCPKRVSLGSHDDELMDKISKISNVWRVFCKTSKRNNLPCFIYEVYMNTDDMKKDPQNKKYDILKRDDVKITHSLGFNTSIDSKNRFIHKR